MARRHGWQVVARVSDRVSGAELERPGLAEGLELIYRGDADILVVHELDRLGRDVAGMLATADKIRTVGGHFYVRDRNIDTSTSEGRLLFTMLAALAEFQRRSNVDKILSGLAHARKRGVRFGRPPTIPAEAVERALELRARRRGRPSWSAIAAELEAAKLGRIDRTSIASAVRRRLQGSAAPARAAARRAR
jgi:DNA invertase Pin-like site-specific DNA recombinase